MKNIRIDFRNFWSSFSTNYHSIYYRFINHYFSINNFSVTIDKDNPEIIFYSVFGEQNTENKAIKVLLCLENLYANRFKKYLQNINSFDYVLCLNEISDQKVFRIPFWFICGGFYDINNHDYKIIKENKIDILNKKSMFSLLSKNPHPLRLFILQQLKNQNIAVDCPGDLSNNVSRIGSKKIDKINFLSQYFFNICPENGWSIGYCTEKLYDALISGCIPIYWGDSSLDNNFYNIDKILTINKNCSNFNDIIHSIVDLTENKTSLIEKAKMSPFSKKRLDIINEQDIKIANFFKDIISIC